jgi:hypothetical protein
MKALLKALVLLNVVLSRNVTLALCEGLLY